MTFGSELYVVLGVGTIIACVIAALLINESKH